MMFGRTFLSFTVCLFLIGCGGAPETFDRGKPKAEYAAAVKSAAALGVMVTCDSTGEVTFLDFHAHPDISAAVQHVSEFPNLKMLNFSSSQLTDADMSPIAGAIHVEELGLHGTQITDAALAQLAELKKLRQLNLTDTGIGDAGLAHLAGLKSLVRLDLQNTKVTDAGLKHLEELTDLVYIELSNSQVTDAGVAQLQAKLPDAQILHETIADFSNVPMLTDAELPD